MRTFALAAIAVLVLLIGGYTAIWYKEADNFKSNLEQGIASMNEKAAALGLPKGFIRYDRVEASGFPFEMNFTFDDAVVDLPVSSILRALPAAKLHAPNPAAPSSLVVEYSSDKPVEIVGSIRGNHYSLILPGTLISKNIINNAVTRTTLTTNSSPGKCELDVEQPIGGTFWTMRPIFTDAKTFVQVFRGFECSFKGVAMSDAATHAKLATEDSTSFRLHNDPANDANRSLLLQMDMANAVFTPAFDALNYELSQNVFSLMGTPQADRPAPLRLSEHGTINMALDIAYKGPTDAYHFADPDMQMRFDINRFNFDSQILHSAFDTHIASEPHGNSRTASIALDAKANLSERYDAILAEQVGANFAQAMDTTGKFGPALMLAQTLKQLGLTPQQLTAIVLPKFHSFGDMSLTIDASVKGPNNRADLFRHGDITLNAFNWTSTLYGIKLKGEANFATADGKPAGELIKTCINCDALITDLGGYIMRLESIGTHMQPPHTPYVTPALVEGVRQFIHGIAENPNAKDLVTNFKFGPMGFTVSGKTLPQLMALYISTIAPVQPHPQAPQPATPGMGVPGGGMGMPRPVPPAVTGR